MIIQFVIECLCLLLAFIAGRIVYEYMNSFFRILFFQLLIWFITFIIGYIITKYQKLHHIHGNNQWLYNIHSLIEVSLLSLAAHTYLNKKREKRMIQIGY